MTTKHTSARLIQVGGGDWHKDALELPDGTQVLLNDLATGQRAYVEDPVVKKLMDDAQAGAAESAVRRREHAHA